MTVAGLVSHLYWVERWLVRARAARRSPTTARGPTEDPDKEFRVDDVPLARLLADYERQCARNNEIARSLDLDAEAKVERRRGAIVDAALGARCT